MRLQRSTSPGHSGPGLQIYRQPRVAGTSSELEGGGGRHVIENSSLSAGFEFGLSEPFDDDSFCCIMFGVIIPIVMCRVT